MCMKVLITAVTVLSLSGRLMAQSPDAPAFENWNLYYQATSIGQTHGTFNAPYTGPLSLQDYREDDVSLTTTLFFDARLAKNLQFVFGPEKEHVGSDANQVAGERPMVRYTITDRKSDANQVAGERPMVRYTI